MFYHLKSMLDPHLDFAVNTLIKRSIDTNEFVAIEGNKALTSMCR